MLNIAGFGVVLGMVFGGYLAAGGKIGIIIAALPFELMMIGGAAVGAFLIANDMHVIKATFGDLKRIMKGAHWHKSDYQDLLCLLHALIKLGRRDAVALETHIEEPDNSPIFQAYPRILADHTARDMICDTLRVSMMNYDDPNQLEPVLEKQLDAKLKSELHTTHALQNLADGLPALGIVAA
ncbi:MAG: motility-associated protein, partial [Pseudomonadota bacterium]